VTDETSEFDVLDAFIGSAAWRLVEARLQEEWGRTGRRYCDVLERLANNADDVKATQQLQQVVWVRKELEQFLAWFPARRNELQAKRDPHVGNPSRRGVL